MSEPASQSVPAAPAAAPVAQPAGDDRRLRNILLGILAAAVLLRFFRITHQSLWFDEGTTLEMTDDTSLFGNLKRFYNLTTGGERFQMLYNLMMPYWRAAFGDGALSLRSFSALAGIGAVAFVTATARRVFGGTHAIWTAVIAATSSFAIFYSQEARPYSFLTMLTAAQLFCCTPILAGWWEARAPISPWWRRGHLIVVLFASFASIFFGLFSTAIAAAHLIVRRDFKAWLRWWLPALAAAVPSILFFLSSGLVSDPANKIVVARHGFPVIESVAFVTYGVLVGLTYGPSVLELHGDNRREMLVDHAGELALFGLVMLAFAAFLAKALARPQTTSERQHNQTGAILLLASLFALALATLLAWVTQVTWLPRHSFYLFATSALVFPLVRHARLGKPQLATALLAAYVALNLYSLHKLYFRYDYSKGDYRGVAEYVAKRKNEMPSVLLLGWPRLLRHYGDDHTKDGTNLPTATLAEGVKQLSGAAPRTLIVLGHEEYWRRTTGADVPTQLKPLYDLEASETFQNFRVYQFALRK